MSAEAEIRGRAKMFNWDTHVDEIRHEDTFIHGENMIAVNYRRDGTVDSAYRYLFFKITEPQLQETTPQGSKKTAVLGWLSRLGS